MANAGYAATRGGIGKAVTIILGIVCVGLTAYSYDRQWKEEVFLGVIITCLVISVLLFAIYMLVTDVELKSSSKATDSGYHFIAALILMAAGALMIYSAVDLRNHWKYFCSYGFDRGIPCLHDKYDDTYGKNYNANQYNPGQNYGLGNTNMEYGAPNGRSFIKPSWLTWLKGANVYEECRHILPRVLRCNEYYELKLASGILGVLNGIVYVITGIMVLLSN